MRILIVDDEQLIKKQLKDKIISIMEDVDIDISASNGREALNEVASFHPDVVFCDIKMPVMDGLEFSRLVKQRYNNLAVVLVSGYADFSFAQSAIKYGVFNYLLKPLDLDKLEETLTDLQSQLLFSNDQPIIQEDDYRICFLNFGNIYPRGKRKRGDKTFFHYLDSLDIDRLFPAQYFPSFLLQEGFYPNQRSIIYKASSMNNDSRKLNEIIRGQYKQLHCRFSLTTAFSEKVVSHHNISVSIQRLRNMVETLSVPCSGESYFLEQDESSQKADIFVSDLIRRGCSLILNHQNDFPRSLLQLFERMFELHIPQIQMYRVVEKWVESLLSEKRVIPDEIVYKHLEQFERDFVCSADCQQIFRSFFAMAESFTPCLKQENSLSDHEKIISYIDKNFARIVSIRDVASLFSYNEAYLSRLFKNLTGKNFITYITDKKIELARSLMDEDPDISVSTVSEMIGYIDQLYFSRVFKNKVGVSPSMYKKQRNG